MSQVALYGGRMVAWMLLVLTSLGVGDWPQWRGPNRDGQVSGFRTPSAWPPELKRAWTVDVGAGHSSPIVAGGKVFEFARRGDSEVLACFNVANGKELWHQSYAPENSGNTNGKGPKSTPALAGNRVFTFGVGGVVTCWDATNGKRVWFRDFSAQFDESSPTFGVSMSPMVDENRCLVHVGGTDKGALIALNVRNGETLWTCAEDGQAYASPVVATLDEVRQVITVSQKSCLGVDLETGKLLWKIPFATESTEQNAVTPLVHDGSLLISGVERGVDRYRIEQQDGEWEVDKIWTNKEVSLSMSSPVAEGERLFGFSHRQKGQLFALDITTGKTLWTSEGRMGENASLVQTGSVVWALTTDSELIAFRATDRRYQQLARFKVADSPTWAHPAFVTDGVLVKDETELTLWQFPPTTDTADAGKVQEKAKTSGKSKATKNEASKAKTPAKSQSPGKSQSPAKSEPASKSKSSGSAKSGGGKASVAGKTASGGKKSAAEK